MKDDELILLLGIGGLMLISRGGPEWGRGWHWPAQSLVIRNITYPAVVSQEFKPGIHRGVDIMYRRRSIHDVPEFAAGVKDISDGFANGSTMHFAPPYAKILAARDARVWSVHRDATGWSVVLDHGKPWATYYGHLATVELPLHTQGKKADGGAPVIVTAGQVIGTMGGNPNTDPRKGAVDSARLRHLHFETWYKGAGNDAAVDPQSEMEARWARA